MSQETVVLFSENAVQCIENVKQDATIKLITDIQCLQAFRNGIVQLLRDQIDKVIWNIILQSGFGKDTFFHDDIVNVFDEQIGEPFHKTFSNKIVE